MLSHGGQLCKNATCGLPLRPAVFIYSQIHSSTHIAKVLMCLVLCYELAMEQRAMTICSPSLLNLQYGTEIDLDQVFVVFEIKLSM